MKLLKILNLLLIFFTICVNVKSFSQNTFTISGTVKNINNELLNLGEVSLLKIENSTINKHTKLEKGIFTFKLITKGEYILKIKSIGYNEIKQTFLVNKDLEIDFVLQDYINNLEEITIPNHKSVFETTNIENIKVNVENTSLDLETNLINILEKLPGIQISVDRESVTYIGKGEALIYVENRQLTTGQLNSMSVENIKTIEILKNPSSKYAANGRVVILITLIKKQKEGYKISLKETLDFRRDFSTYSSISLSSKFKKLELKSNFEYNKLQQWESNAFDYDLQNINLESSYRVIINTIRTEIKGGLGLYYDINNHEYISYNTNIKNRNDNDYFNAHSVFNKSEVNELTRTRNLSNQHQLLFTNNINYNNKLTAIDGNLLLGLQYTTFLNKSKQNINDINNFNQITNSAINQRYNVNNWSALFDFENSFKNNFKLQMGSKVILANATTNFDALLNVIGNENSKYNFKEENYSLYTQLIGEIKKVNFSAGIRSETTYINGGFKNSNQKIIDSNFINLFPKAGFCIKIDSTKTLSLNYARSINRPNYKSFNQSKVYINPNVVFEGNLSLKPAINDEISTSLKLKKTLLEVSYSKKENPFYYIPSFDNKEDLFTFQLQNIQQEKTFILALTYPIDIKVWKSHNYIAGYISKIEDKNAVLGKSTPFFYYYSNNEFFLPKKYVLSLSGWITTPSNEGLYQRDESWTVDLEISKKFGNKIKCKLNFNDVFNTLKYPEQYTFNNIRSNGTWFTNYRRISLSLKYSFGEMKATAYKNKEINQKNRL